MIKDLAKRQRFTNINKEAEKEYIALRELNRDNRYQLRGIFKNNYSMYGVQYTWVVRCIETDAWYNVNMPKYYNELSYQILSNEEAIASINRGGERFKIVLKDKTKNGYDIMLVDFE